MDNVRLAIASMFSWRSTKTGLLSLIFNIVTLNSGVADDRELSEAITFNRYILSSLESIGFSGLEHR